MTCIPPVGTFLGFVFLPPNSVHTDDGLLLPNPVKEGLLTIRELSSWINAGAVRKNPPLRLAEWFRHNGQCEVAEQVRSWGPLPV
jgi:hypothetical protein